MRRIRLAGWVIGLACAFAAAPAHAATLDQHNDSSGLAGEALIGSPGGTGPFNFAQTFTAGLSGSLTQVDLWLRADPTQAADLTVEIRNTSSGAPGTTVLATAMVPASSLSNTAAFYSVTFATPTVVTAGSQYAIVMYTTSSTAVFALGETVSSGSGTGYPDGALWENQGPPPPGLGWAELTATDGLFRTYVTIGAYGLPGTVGALSFGENLLSFRVLSPARVRFTLDRRMANKRFRRIGSFRLFAHRGLNHTAIPRQLHGHRLRHGTYRVTARAYKPGLGSGPATKRLIVLR